MDNYALIHGNKKFSAILGELIAFDYDTYISEMGQLIAVDGDDIAALNMCMKMLEIAIELKSIKDVHKDELSRLLVLFNESLLKQIDEIIANGADNSENDESIVDYSDTFKKWCDKKERN